MTAVSDQKTRVVSQLINSCYRAQDGYRTAASTVEDQTLRRLFEIYAQQRTRFAEELREYLPTEVATETNHGFSGAFALDSGENEKDSIRECLEIDSRTLALYKEALAHRALPTRAHFLISSQLALLERVHDRMNGMFDGRVSSQPYLREQRISA
jgi:hypothetical protein